MRRLLLPLLLVGVCISLSSCCETNCPDTADYEKRLTDLERWVTGDYPDPERLGAQEWMTGTFNFLIEIKDNQCALITKVNEGLAPADRIPVPSWCEIVPPPPPIPPCDLGEEDC